MTSTEGQDNGAPAPAPAPSGTRLARVRRSVLLTTAAGAAVAAVVTVLATRGTESVVKEDPQPTCPGDDCGDRNPETTDCGADAGSYRPAESNPALLDVRYNPRCHAVWGRILNGEPGDRVTVAVTGGGVTEAEIAWGFDQFTKMVAVDERDFVVEVCAIPTGRRDREADWLRYCIEATEETEFLLR
ncbi:DUF2690 domain-containing protein [Streptomyces sp. SBT349]|uniref:DUF2690 domain-containing protein n=1 Tax=Streptomyces sp. SBT349 TaxID=1580539 RepID=UPI00131E1184|nr:DUF2690 domain-containing protein [Streptomyces sp. SBT349]